MSEPPDPQPISPDPPPLGGRAALLQRWSELAFVHWPYEPEVVAPLLPPGTRLDTHGGAAWIGLVPFTMVDVRPTGWPVLPWISRFVEVNVRTYVVDPLGRRAVWFFSLDAPRWPVVLVGRAGFAVPYRLARAVHAFDGARHGYGIRRRGRGPREARLHIEIEPGARIPDDEVTPLEHFLTARWGLVGHRHRGLRHVAVRHPRWPLHRARAHALEETLLRAAGLPEPEGEPLVHYSPDVDVRIGYPTRLDPLGAETPPRPAAPRTSRDGG